MKYNSDAIYLLHIINIYMHLLNLTKTKNKPKRNFCISQLYTVLYSFEEKGISILLYAKQDAFLGKNLSKSYLKTDTSGYPPIVWSHKELHCIRDLSHQAHCHHLEVHR